MSKQKPKDPTRTARPAAYSGFTINENKTLGPESSYDRTTSENTDATSAHNLADEEETAAYSPTTAGLTDKYLLSGKYDVPIWRIAFLLLAAASVFIFVQDNNSGAFKQGDWWAIVWTIQKCLMLSSAIFLLLLLHSLSNWVRKKFK